MVINLARRRVGGAALEALETRVRRLEATLRKERRDSQKTLREAEARAEHLEGVLRRMLDGALPLVEALLEEHEAPCRRPPVAQETTASSVPEKVVRPSDPPVGRDAALQSTGDDADFFPSDCDDIQPPTASMTFGPSIDRQPCASEQTRTPPRSPLLSEATPARSEEGAAPLSNPATAAAATVGGKTHDTSIPRAPSLMLGWPIPNFAVHTLSLADAAPAFGLAAGEVLEQISTMSRSATSSPSTTRPATPLPATSLPATPLPATPLPAMASPTTAPPATAPPATAPPATAPPATPLPATARSTTPLLATPRPTTPRPTTPRPATAGSVKAHLVVTAANNGQLKVLERLLKEGADPNACARSGRTALHCAVSQGNMEVVQLLLAHGADPARVDDDGLTPLHRAASRCSVGCVKRLLRAGADVNARDRLGWTPLADAVSSRREDMVQLLLRAGADAKSREDVKAHSNAAMRKLLNA